MYFWYNGYIYHKWHHCVNRMTREWRHTTLITSHFQLKPVPRICDNETWNFIILHFSIMSIIVYTHLKSNTHDISVAAGDLFWNGVCVISNNEFCLIVHKTVIKISFSFSYLFYNIHSLFYTFPWDYLWSTKCEHWKFFFINIGHSSIVFFLFSIRKMNNCSKYDHKDWRGT